MKRQNNNHLCNRNLELASDLILQIYSLNTINGFPNIKKILNSNSRKKITEIQYITALLWLSTH